MKKNYLLIFNIIFLGLIIFSFLLSFLILSFQKYDLEYMCEISKRENVKIIHHDQNIVNFFLHSDTNKIINDILDYSKEEYQFFLEELEEKNVKNVDLLRKEIEENFLIVGNVLKENFNKEKQGRYLFGDGKGFHRLMKHDNVNFINRELGKKTGCLSFKSNDELKKCSISKYMYAFFNNKNQFSKYGYIKIKFSDLNIEYFRSILEEYIQRDGMFKLFLESRLEEINENILNNNSIF